MKLQVLKIWLLKKLVSLDIETTGATHSVYRFPTFIKRWMKLSFCLLNVWFWRPFGITEVRKFPSFINEGTGQYVV